MKPPQSFNSKPASRLITGILIQRVGAKGRVIKQREYGNDVSVSKAVEDFQKCPERLREVLAVSVSGVVYEGWKKGVMSNENVYRRDGVKPVDFDTFEMPAEKWREMFRIGVKPKAGDDRLVCLSTPLSKEWVQDFGVENL